MVHFMTENTWVNYSGMLVSHAYRIPVPHAALVLWPGPDSLIFMRHFSESWKALTKWTGKNP